MKKLSILVTGGAGFVGSHIVDAYVAAGHNVAIVDNLSTGNPAYINPKARFFNVDVRDFSSLCAVFEEFKPDVVNHQAALASVVGSTSKPTETYDVNTIGTINTLIAAAPFVKRFIFASSGGALHGAPTQFPPSEEVPVTPLSTYGFSKKLAEDAVIFYAGIYGFEYVILRPANIYGPRQNAGAEGGVVAIFAKLATLNKPATIYGQKTTRDYVFVSDIARANVLALAKGKNSIFHLATSKEISNKEVQQAIAQAFHWQAKPLIEKARAGEVRRSALSAKKAERILGWRPEVSFSQGIALLKSGS